MASVKLGIIKSVGDVVPCPHGHVVELMEYKQDEDGSLLVTLDTDCETCRDAELSWDVPDPDRQGWPREGLEVWVALPEPGLPAATGDDTAIA